MILFHSKPAFNNNNNKKKHIYIYKDRLLYNHKYQLLILVFKIGLIKLNKTGF